MLSTSRAACVGGVLALTGAPCAHRAPNPNEVRAKTVVLRLHVDEQGTIQDAKVVDTGGPDSDAAALKAVEHLRFRRHDGESGTLEVLYKLTFVPGDAGDQTAVDPGLQMKLINNN